MPDDLDSCVELPSFTGKRENGRRSGNRAGHSHLRSCDGLTVDPMLRPRKGERLRQRTVQVTYLKRHGRSMIDVLARFFRDQHR